MLVILHLLVYGLCVHAVIINNIYPDLFVAFLLLLISVTTLDNAARYALLWHPQSVMQAVFSQGNWRLQQRSGVWLEASVGRPAYVTTWLIVVGFNTRAGVRYMVLLRDALTAEQFRRFYVLMRFDKSQSQMTQL